jgi:hypothetical protein
MDNYRVFTKLNSWNLFQIIININFDRSTKKKKFFVEFKLLTQGCQVVIDHRDKISALDKNVRFLIKNKYAPFFYKND